MNESFNTFFRGLLFGFGLGIMLLIIFKVYETYEIHMYQKWEKQLIELIKAKERKMSIRLIMSKYTEGGMVTHLSVLNNGEESVNNYVVETEFFDENGVFIGECLSKSIIKIEPGHHENIEVFCEDRWPSWYKKVASTQVKFR